MNDFSHNTIHAIAAYTHAAAESEKVKRNWNTLGAALDIETDIKHRRKESTMKIILIVLGICGMCLAFFYAALEMGVTPWLAGALTIALYGAFMAREAFVTGAAS